MKEAVELRLTWVAENFECPEGSKFVEIDAGQWFDLKTLHVPHRELMRWTNASRQPSNAATRKSAGPIGRRDG